MNPYGLTDADRLNAHVAIQRRWHLTWRQREKLARHPAYTLILSHAKNGAWESVAFLLREAGLIPSA